MDTLALLDEAGYKTGYITYDELMSKIIGSGDLDDDFTPELFEKKLQDKFEECSDSFVQDISANGVEQPMLFLEESGGWSMLDGHHRLACARYFGGRVPYCIVLDEDDVFYVYTTMGYDFSKDFGVDY